MTCEWCDTPTAKDALQGSPLTPDPHLLYFPKIYQMFYKAVMLEAMASLAAGGGEVGRRSGGGGSGGHTGGHDGEGSGWRSGGGGDCGGRASSGGGVVRGGRSSGGAGSGGGGGGGGDAEVDKEAHEPSVLTGFDGCIPVFT